MKASAKIIPERARWLTGRSWPHPARHGRASDIQRAAVRGRKYRTTPKLPVLDYGRATAT